METETGVSTARGLDVLDELKEFRSRFYLPIFSAVGADLIDKERSSEHCTYLCGNSLGPLAKRSEELIKEELAVWSTRAVDGHFNHPHERPWLPIADLLCPSLAKLVGAEIPEVACMGTLTANLHLLMTSFYNPTPDRFKIICEAKAFPSDRYAFKSQALLHGFDPADAVIEIAPRDGEYTLREEDIIAAIEQHGSQTALVLFSGVQFYTGQWFPMESITRHAKKQGSIVGFDLAHAIGNVPLSLHDWGVDFAVWCSYKYLNSGPGGIGGLFVHSKWDSSLPPKLRGWWGHNEATRFKMPPDHDAIPGAAGYQQSNPSALLAVSLLGSLELFDQAGGIQALRKKSLVITAFLEAQLRASKHFFDLKLNDGENPSVVVAASARKKTAFTIITPRDPSQRGAQLSLLWPAGEGAMQQVHRGLKRRGVIGDEREPNVIRLSPAPLYNTFADCERAARVLEEVLDEVSAEEDRQR